MRKHLSLLAGVAVVLGVAPAAHATAIPFDVHYRHGGEYLEAGVEYAYEPGFVGVCGEDTCQGFELSVRTARVTASTSPFTITLRGYACIADTSSYCSSNGLPFTGVKVHERTLDAPEGDVDPVVVSATLCMWQGGWTPGTCTSVPAEELIVEGRDTGNLAEPAPTTLGV